MKWIGHGFCGEGPAPHSAQSQYRMSDPLEPAAIVSDTGNGRDRADVECTDHDGDQGEAPRVVVRRLGYNASGPLGEHLRCHLLRLLPLGPAPVNSPGDYRAVGARVRDQRPHSSVPTTSSKSVMATMPHSDTAGMGRSY